MGKRVLVTGGAGFIGSHITESLVRHGYDVTVYDNFSTGLNENLDRVRNHVRIVEGDILDRNRLMTEARRADVITHHAAQLEITKCLEDPVDDLRINLIGTINVLEAARAAGVERIINASSACIYGQGITVPSEEDSHPQNPNWSYGASKLAAEKYAQVFSQDGLSVYSLRYGIVYGPREWYGRVLTIFLKRALERLPPVIFGLGDQIRDFVFVGDVVRIHDALMSTELEGAHSFNVGTGVATTIRDLALLVCNVCELDREPVFEDVHPGERSTLVSGRMRLPSELMTMLLSPVKSERMIGISPTVALADGLQREWEWLQKERGRWTVMHY